MLAPGVAGHPRDHGSRGLVGPEVQRTAGRVVNQAHRPRPGHSTLGDEGPVLCERPRVDLSSVRIKYYESDRAVADGAGLIDRGLRSAVLPRVRMSGRGF
jgi:hypothetical protein